jgi:hypothetical protein
MADWNQTAPLDNAVISQYPANERAARSAVVTNFGVDHQSTDGAQVGFHKQITMPERATDPSAAADVVFLYTKDVSGTTEVFYRDAAGNISQLTKAGRVVGQLKPVTKTSNYTAVAGDDIMVDKSGGNVTITLPASPAIGDEPIWVTHIVGTSNTLTIARNGNPIMGLAEDLVVDANYASVSFRWAGASAGWRIGIIG